MASSASRFPASGTSVAPLPDDGDDDDESCAAVSQGEGYLAQGATAAAHAQQQHPQQYEWPTVSFARVRAGLRAALKTECSGFKFQNGGRSLRWFKEHPIDERARGRLFWQGHMSMLEHQWIHVKPPNAICIWAELSMLDRAYRRRYSVHSRESGSAEISHVQAMLEDGNVERAVRWALDIRSGMRTTLFAVDGAFYRRILLALALVGGWTWLLRPWLEAVLESPGEDEWRDMLVLAAIETGCLSVVQDRWVHSQSARVRKYEIPMAVGRSGSLEIFDWLTEHSSNLFLEDSTSIVSLLEAASEYGHVALMEHVLFRKPDAEHILADYGKEVLQCACLGGSLHAVEWLVSRGGEPDAVELMCAVESGNFRVMHYLCEQTANVGLPVLLPAAVDNVVASSKPDCLAILEHLVHCCQYVSSSESIVNAATAANVRPDVICFLDAHAPREVWAGALSHKDVCNDLDIRDLLNDAARAAA